MVVTTNSASDFALNVVEVETELFGCVRGTKRRRSKVSPAASSEDAAPEDIASSAEVALSRLSNEITEVISRFRNEVAGWPGSNTADEVDALLERLDEDLTASVRRARREALW